MFENFLGGKKPKDEKEYTGQVAKEVETSTGRVKTQEELDQEKKEREGNPDSWREQP